MAEKIIDPLVVLILHYLFLNFPNEFATDDISCEQSDIKKEIDKFQDGDKIKCFYKLKIYGFVKGTPNDGSITISGLALYDTLTLGYNMLNDDLHTQWKQKI